MTEPHRCLEGDRAREEAPCWPRGSCPSLPPLSPMTPQPCFLPPPLFLPTPLFTGTLRWETTEKDRETAMEVKTVDLCGASTEEREKRGS